MGKFKLGAGAARKPGEMGMKWFAVFLFLASLIWTALSYLAYRDSNLAFQSSAVAWLISALLWAAVRVNLAGLRRSGSDRQKTNRVARSWVGVAAAVLVVSSGLVVLGVLTARWLGRPEAGSEASSTAPPRAAERDFTQPRVENEGKEKEPPQREKLWSVQVGAFRSEQDAVKVAKTLRAKGYEAYVIRAEVGGAVLYRIKVGRFAKRGEAEKLLILLKDKEAYRTAFLAATSGGRLESYVPIAEH